LTVELSIHNKIYE